MPTFDEIDWDEARRLARGGSWAALADLFTGQDDPGVDEAALARDVGSLLTDAERRAASKPDVRALFFEIDDEGRTAVFLSTAYLPDDDWPASFDEWVDGPTLPVEESGGDRRLHACAGAAFAALGRCLDERTGRLPVGFGIHDGIVLYGPLPPGVPGPEDVPKTLLPRERRGLFRLGPHRTDPRMLSAVDLVGIPDGRRAGRVGFAVEQWCRHDDSYRRDVEALRGAQAQLRRGGLDDLVHLGTVGGPFLASERLFSTLRDSCAAGEDVEAVELSVLDGEGGVHRYHACRPSRTIRSVDLEPRHRIAVARGRSMPAFRSRDVADARVFAELSRYFRMFSLALVSGEVLTRLETAGCLVGVRADSLIVLEPGEERAGRPAGGEVPVR